MNIEISEIKLAILVIGTLSLVYGVMLSATGGTPDNTMLSTAIAAIAGLAGVEVGKKLQ